MTSAYQFQFEDQIISVPVQFSTAKDLAACVELIETLQLVPGHDRSIIQKVNVSTATLPDYLRSCNLFKRNLVLLVYACPRMEMPRLIALMEQIEGKRMKKYDVARFKKDIVIFSRLLSIGRLFQICSSLVLLRKNSSVFARLGSYKTTNLLALEALAQYLQNNPGFYTAAEMRSFLISHNRGLCNNMPLATVPTAKCDSELKVSSSWVEQKYDKERVTMKDDEKDDCHPYFRSVAESDNEFYNANRLLTQALDVDVGRCSDLHVIDSEEFEPGSDTYNRLV
jgi:hypothetical protein